ncbi:beta-ketoacyl synthase chain length factor [Rhizobacter fulvus]
MSLPSLFVEGIALWAPTLPGWDTAAPALRGEGRAVDPPATRPLPELLPAAERRRAPDSVALSLEVAARAVAQSGRAPSDLLSVFTSAHGDLAITDYVCSTLARAPWSMSPTRFHNSVHNAASGYWGIATGCMQASTAVSAFECSFAAGLLEAWTQAAADAGPVLLVGCDVAATGALASTNDSRGLLAVALVLARQRGPRALARLDAMLVPGAAGRIPLRSEAALPLAGNAMADALPLFETLAGGAPEVLTLPLSAMLGLRVQVCACRDRG